MKKLSNNLRYTLLSLPLVALILASPDDDATAKGILLQYGSRQPSVARYHTVLSGRTQVFVDQKSKEESVLKSDMYVTQHSSLQKDGLLRLETKIESGMMDLNGEKVPVPMSGTSFGATIRRNGQVVEAPVRAGFDMSQLQFVLPSKEVEVGHRWSELIAATDQVPVSLKAEYEVIGSGIVEGKPCVKISSKIRSQDDSNIQGLTMKVNSSGDILFDLEHGQILRSNVQSQLDMIMSSLVDKSAVPMVTKMVVTSSTRVVE
jgi:hypothetical protein